MTTLDRVTEMQGQGKTDTEIMAQLQNEGISPNEINQSLQQAKVKSAISQPQTTPQGMQPSITEQMPTQETQQETNQPQTQQTQTSPQEYPQQESLPIPGPTTPAPAQYQQEQIQQAQQYQQQYPEYDPNQQYYPQTPQAYSQDQQYYPQESYSTETISEIASQIATEILDDYKQKVGDIASFKNQTQNKIEDLNDRLKKIENSIDKLQQAVLGKIGEFGDTTAMIHHDLDNLHGTVAKLMNPLIDNIELMEKHNKRKSKK